MLRFFLVNLVFFIVFSVQGQNYFGRWYLVDFMKSRTGVIAGTYFSKDSVKHFITDPFLSGTYIENLKFPYTRFNHQNYEIICQKESNVIYIIVLKYINYNQSEIYVPSKTFHSIDEVKQYLKNTSLTLQPFIPIYSERYLRTFSQLKPFHQITPKEFEKVMLNAFHLFDTFEKKYSNHKQVKANTLINIFISQSLLKMGYSPFAISFPEILTQGDRMMKLSNQLDAYSKKW